MNAEHIRAAMRFAVEELNRGDRFSSAPRGAVDVYEVVRYGEHGMQVMGRASTFAQAARMAGLTGVISGPVVGDPTVGIQLVKGVQLTGRTKYREVAEQWLFGQPSQLWPDCRRLSSPDLVWFDEEL